MVTVKDDFSCPVLSACIDDSNDRQPPAPNTRSQDCFNKAQNCRFSL